MVSFIIKQTIRVHIREIIVRDESIDWIAKQQNQLHFGQHRFHPNLCSSTLKVCRTCFTGHVGRLNERELVDVPFGRVGIVARSKMSLGPVVGWNRFEILTEEEQLLVYSRLDIVVERDEILIQRCGAGFGSAYFPFHSLISPFLSPLLPLSIDSPMMMKFGPHLPSTRSQSSDM